MKYIAHNFTDKGVRVEFDAHGKNILFFTPDTPIADLPEQVQNEATALWTPDYVQAYLDSLEPSLEQWRQSFSVPTYKLEIELEERGLMTTVQVLIDGASRSTQIGWEKSPTVRRMSPTMVALAQHPSLALTAEDLDDIFKSANLREL